MPLPDDKEALTTGLWRIVFVLPGVFAAIQIFMLVFFFRFDTPLFYKKIGDNTNYHRIMSKIFLHHKVETEEKEVEEPEVVEASIPGGSNNITEMNIIKQDGKIEN